MYQLSYFWCLSATESYGQQTESGAESPTSVPGRQGSVKVRLQ